MCIIKVEHITGKYVCVYTVIYIYIVCNRNLTRFPESTFGVFNISYNIFKKKEIWDLPRTITGRFWAAIRLLLQNYNNETARKACWISNRPLPTSIKLTPWVRHPTSPQNIDHKVLGDAHEINRDTPYMFAKSFLACLSESLVKVLWFTTWALLWKQTSK